MYLYQVRTSLNQLTIFRLQLVIWLFVSIAIFVSLLAMDGLLQATVYTLLNVGFYAMIIYGNISFLYPALQQKGKPLLYVLGVMLLIALSGAGRGILTYLIYSNYFSTKPTPFSYSILVNYTFSALLIFSLSFIVRYALEYFKLLDTTKSIISRQNKAELDLLKSQVNPHFLFNTLNNIYYEAYLESPKTALLIERLAEMMRYMVEENKKEKVLLSKEVAFLENYIALEQIRLLHGLKVELITTFPAALELPPMLLIAFIENIFKHGIDKSADNNQLKITLRYDHGFLVYETVNTRSDNIKTPAGGSGLENLRQRLVLLYGSEFELRTNAEENSFTAYFKIPVS